MNITRDGTRTHSLLLRIGSPSPLGHTSTHMSTILYLSRITRDFLPLSVQWQKRPSRFLFQWQKRSVADSVGWRQLPPLMMNITRVGTRAHSALSIRPHKHTWVNDSRVVDNDKRFPPTLFSVAKEPLPRLFSWAKELRCRFDERETGTTMKDEYYS